MNNPSDMKELYTDDTTLSDALDELVDTAILSAKIAELESLLTYSRAAEFSTADQFREKIYSDIKLLNKLKSEKGGF